MAAQRHSGTGAQGRHGGLGEASLPEAGNIKILVTGDRWENSLTLVAS